MGKHSMNAAAIADSPVANAVEGIASEYIAEQPWFKAHQNTLLSVGQGILQALNILLTIISGGTYPIWVTIIVAVLLSTAQVIVTAASAAPVTEKNKANLIRFAESKVSRSSIRDFYATKEE